MASSSDLPDANPNPNPNPAAAEPTPPAPQTDPIAVSVASQDPIPAPSPPIPSQNFEPFGMQDAARTEMNVLNPLPISQHPPASPDEAGSPRRRGRKRGGARVGGEFLVPEQFPEWVPKDWQVMKRARPTGSVVDTYYIEPSKNRQLRSKTQVLEFLANGVLKKNPKRVQKKDGATKVKKDGATKVKDGATKVKKDGTTKVKKDGATEVKKDGTTEVTKDGTTKVLHSESPEPINSDSIPEKVRWVHTNSAGDGDSWTPFIGEERVPEDMRLEWKAKCDPLLPTNGGSTA